MPPKSLVSPQSIAEDAGMVGTGAGAGVAPAFPVGAGVFAAKTESFAEVFTTAVYTGEADAVMRTAIIESCSNNSLPPRFYVVSATTILPAAVMIIPPASFFKELDSSVECPLAQAVPISKIALSK